MTLPTTFRPDPAAQVSYPYGVYQGLWHQQRHRMMPRHLPHAHFKRDAFPAQS